METEARYLGLLLWRHVGGLAFGLVLGLWGLGLLWCLHLCCSGVGRCGLVVGSLGGLRGSGGNLGFLSLRLGGCGLGLSSLCLGSGTSSLGLSLALGSFPPWPFGQGTVDHPGVFIVELFEEPSVYPFPEVAKAAGFAFHFRSLVLADFKIELAAFLELEVEPVSEFELVRVIFRGEGFPRVVYTIEKRLDLSV